MKNSKKFSNFFFFSHSFCNVSLTVSLLTYCHSLHTLSLSFSFLSSHFHVNIESITWKDKLSYGISLLISFFYHSSFYQFLLFLCYTSFLSITHFITSQSLSFAFLLSPSDYNSPSPQSFLIASRKIEEDHFLLSSYENLPLLKTNKKHSIITDKMNKATKTDSLIYERNQQRPLN